MVQVQPFAENIKCSKTFYLFIFLPTFLLHLLFINSFMSWIPDLGSSVLDPRLDAK